VGSGTEGCGFRGSGVLRACVRLAHSPPRTLSPPWLPPAQVHRESKVPLRCAAYMVALERVAKAEMHRGFD